MGNAEAEALCAVGETDAPHAVEVDAGQRLVRRRKAYKPALGSPAAAVLQESADLGLGRAFRAVIVTAGHPRHATGRSGCKPHKLSGRGCC